MPKKLSFFSSYTINLLIAYDENTSYFSSKIRNYVALHNSPIVAMTLWLSYPDVIFLYPTKLATQGLCSIVASPTAKRVEDPNRTLHHA